MSILFAGITQVIFGLFMTMTAIFLILLVLVQRGRGGGLSGALGGMGGQSAFGTKAGDTFTKITIVASIFWILLCVLAVKVLSPTENQFGNREAKQVEPPGGFAPPALEKEDPTADEPLSDALEDSEPLVDSETE